jgi:hypothetical protein
MAVRRTPLQSYNATVAKFRKLDMSMASAAGEIRRDLARDLVGFVSGASPTGKARLKWLRAQGYPYGRGSGAATSTSTGRKRGAGQKGTAPTLPIGEISGRLKKAAYVTLTTKDLSYKLTAGFNRRAGKSIYAVLPGGTRKMVSRDLWAKGEKGAVGQRVKIYRKAFRDVYITGNQKP